MKKLLALLLVLCMVFSVATLFAGCDDSGSKKKSSSSKKDDEEEEEDEAEEDEKDDDENEDKEDVVVVEPNKPVLVEDLDGAKQAFTNYVNTVFYFDAEAAQKIATSEFWENSAISLDVALEHLAPAMEYYYETYYPGIGDLQDVENQITSHELVTIEQLDACKQSLQERYGMNSELIDSAYIFAIEMALTGDLYSYTEQGNMLAVRYDGNWYPFFGSYNLDDEFNFQTCSSAGDFLTYAVEEYLMYQIPELEFGEDLSASTDMQEAAYYYMDVLYGGDDQKLYATAPAEYWNTVNEEYTPDILKTALYFYTRDMNTSREWELGADFMYAANVTDTIQIDDASKAAFFDALIAEYGLDPEKMDDLVLLTYDIVFSGAENSAEITDEKFYMLGYDGCWYVIDAGFYMSGDAFAIFMTTYLVDSLPEYMG